jgi:anthranilate phosphoribosyltransferase
MIEEHSFANYIRILGKGKNGARDLTQEEAYSAMQQIYCYDVAPEQLGAFLMLMRVKEETAEEVAGFVKAIRESIPFQSESTNVAVDWSSYAGKRRQMPWYLLSALTLGKSGYPVFMHGMHREDDRIYTRAALHALGMKESRDLKHAQSNINELGFAYMDIEKISTHTLDLIETRQLLGLRPPLHTVVRMINPFSAPLMLQGVFHPNYAETHQLAAKIMEQPKALAFKGEGGEVERIPERSVKLYGLTDGDIWQEEWPAILPPDKYVTDNYPDWNHYRAVWEGESDDRYGFEAIIGTLALVLRSLGNAGDYVSAHEQARLLWDGRHDTDSGIAPRADMIA